MKRYQWGIPNPSLIKGDKVMCPKCLKERAVVDSVFGVLMGKKCRAKASNVEFNKYPEFTSQEVKKGREEFASDMVQSHRGGKMSREYAELYPERTREMIKAGVVSKKEVKNSKYVWRGDIHKNWERKRKIDADMI